MTSLVFAALMGLSQAAVTVDKFPIPDSPIQISQPVRRGKYIESAGRRAVLMGREEGVFECWIYPLKVVRDLNLTFTLEGYSYPLRAADLAEWVAVRPESTTITFAHPAFTVRAHVFTPLDRPGSMILLDVDSARKLTVTASFLIDLIPMWPGGLGGQYSYWDEKVKGFVLTESTRRHAAVIGCPAATGYSSQPAHNLPDAATQFRIDIDPAYAERHFVPIALAGGIMAPAAAVDEYRRMLDQAAALYAEKVRHFEGLRARLAAIESPDPALDRALEWAKAALDTGFVCNPQLGCGQVAGLGLSGTSARPGFGWFFGGDTYINSFAVASTGEFEVLRRQLEFLRARQRADGKMMHELSQAGAMIPWFTDYPYGYYHADTTPLYLIAAENYLRHSGDAAFVRESWESLEKAWRYCLSADADGDRIMDNSKAGLAAVETGKLLDRIATDVYLAAVSTEAHRAMGGLAAAAGRGAEAEEARAAFASARDSLNRKFWDPEKRLLSFALGQGGGRNDEITAWPAVALLFRLVPPETAAAMLDRFAGAALSTDWGVRMLASTSVLYDAVSYNNGAVWPFLNGFASWAEYRNHRPAAAFMHWSQGALLTYAHALGFVPELLSGDYHLALDTAVPHQLFSSSAVVTALVKGMLGFYPSAADRVIELEPHLPVRWSRLKVRNLRVGSGSLDLAVRREAETMVFEIDSSGLEGFLLKLSPGLEPGAAVKDVKANGKPLRWTMREAGDLHCDLELRLTGKDEVRIGLVPGVRIVEPLEPAAVGERARQLRIVRVAWDAASKSCRLDLEGRSGASYVIEVLSPERVASVEGARWSADGRIDVNFPPSGERYAARTVRVLLR